MGLSIRGYAQHRGALGLPGASHTAVRKALAAGRITAEPDGSIDPVRADAQWAGQTDPSMQRGAAAQAQAAETRAASGQGPAPTRPVPRAALDAVQETLAEAGQDPEPEAGGQVTLVRAKLAREIITAQLLKVKLQREKGELVDRARDSGNTVLAKRIPGGGMVIAGANSAVGLRSMPARNVFLDEVDAYPGDLDGEGDPIKLAEARTISFGHRAKLFLASTPTIAGLSRIEREWELSDQRRYHLPCPHCGGLQWLKFERLRWAKGRPDSAVYVCEHCDEPIEERHKTWMMEPDNGACWIATADPETLAAARRAGVVGFHISGLYSPLGWLSWPGIAEQWEAAQGNDAALKTFKNTILGETWQERGEAPDWQRLYDRRVSEAVLGRVPQGALVLTAGADVQRDRIEVDVWGWGRELRSWLVDHIVLEGDTSRAEVWERLDALLGQTWEHASGARMSLARMAIDTGDGLTTDAVYAWVRRAGRGQVIAVKGVGGFDRSMPVDGPTFVEVTEGGRKIRRGVQLWKVAGAVFKAETYRFLRLEQPTDEALAEGAVWPAGFVHIPRGGVTAEWLKQLTAEQLVTIRDKRRGYQRLEWQQTRERNEALDCRVYARAAAWLMGIDRWDDARWQELEAQHDTGQPDPPPAGAPERRAQIEPVRRAPGRKRWFR